MRPMRSRLRTATWSSARRLRSLARSRAAATRRPRWSGATSTTAACGSTRCAASPRSGTCAATRASPCCATTRGKPLRYLEIRGTVIEMTEVGAAEHLDALASKYVGRQIRYFGDAVPARFARDGGAGAVLDSSDARRRPGRPGCRGEGRSCPGHGQDPGLARGPAGQADLRGVDDDRPGRVAAVEHGVDRLGRRVRPRQHDARAPEGAESVGEPKGFAARRRS